MISNMKSAFAQETLREKRKKILKQLYIEQNFFYGHSNYSALLCTFCSLILIVEISLRILHLNVEWE